MAFLQFREKSQNRTACEPLTKIPFARGGGACFFNILEIPWPDWYARLVADDDSDNNHRRTIRLRTRARGNNPLVPGPRRGGGNEHGCRRSPQLPQRAIMLLKTAECSGCFGFALRGDVKRGGGRFYARSV